VTAPAQRTDRAIAAALAIGAALYLLALRGYGLMLLDDGWVLQPVARMLRGEILYRDVWTFYAPGIHHLLAWLFAWTGFSLLAARTLYAACIVLSVVMTYRVARRFAPPPLAWIPAAVYGLAPGPWHKAYFGTLSLGCFLLLARALEAPRASRFAALGALAGVALVTRQDVGLLALAIALVAAWLPSLWPDRFGNAEPRSIAAGARASAAVLGAFAVPVGATAAYYASHQALGPLLDAVFGAAFGQAGAHPDVLGSMLRPATFAMAPEGRGVGTILLLPLLLYPLSALLLLRALRRDGITPATALRGAILGFATATLTQAYYPMLLLRFLQSALPFYLLATIAASDLSRALRARGAAALPGVALGAAGAALVGLVCFGFPQIPQPIYTGSLRMLRYHEPVAIGSETVLESFALADEVRLVRAFYQANAPADQPTAGFPDLPTYNLLLDRPNPTAWIGEHSRGNFVLSVERKQREAERLLASDARFVLVRQQWYARPGVRDPMLEMLRAEFRPVRGYGTVLILERGTDPAWQEFGARLRRTLVTAPVPADLVPWQRFAEEHPDEPLAWRMLGLTRQATGNPVLAVDALHRAADLDPADATPLESAAQLLARMGKQGQAVADLRRARAIRDSATIRTLSEQLGAPAP